jgi:predicted nucleic acid-binding protein
MKITITIALILVASISMAQTKADTSKRYRFSEPDVILIDQLMGQLDIVSGNSDKVSTAQYNAIRHSIARVDSLIKAQYSKFHPAKSEPKKP